MGLLLAVAFLRAEDPKLPAQAEYRRPELVAMTWQSWTKTTVPERKPVVWRPDGSLLDADEVDWLCNDLQSSATLFRPQNGQVRPLVLVFRIDERAKLPQSLQGGVKIREQFPRMGFAMPSTKHFLAQMILVPTRGQLGAWPPEIDVEIKVPVGEPEVVKSFDQLPKGELKIADGVRWSIDPTQGARTVNGKRTAGAPAAVFEIDEKFADPLSTYSCVVRLKNGQQLRSQSMMTMDDGSGLLTTTNVSAPLDPSNPIVSGEFIRIRHRLERYEKLPTRLDLKPEDPKPALPALRGL
jgi:hypothetical protein